MSGRDYVIVGNPWHYGVDNPTSKHHVARELAARGRRVLWVDGAGLRTPRLGSGLDRGRIRERLRLATEGLRSVEPNIWVCSPLIVPLPRRRLIRWLNDRIYGWVLRSGARRLRLRQPALINFLLLIPGAMQRWPGPTVYYCVDRWDAFHRYDSATMRALNTACCRAADRVVSSATDLHTEARRHNPRAHLLLHGVQHAHFARALRGVDRPADLPAGPVVGVIGLIDERVDQPLLVTLARVLPAVAVVFIGKADVDTAGLANEPNIHLLAPRPFADLPDYVGAFAVGLIPYVVDDQTRAVNPIKLREMMAAGCPVAATGLPEVAAYVAGRGEVVARCCRTAGDPDAFVAAVRSLLDHPPTPADRAALSAAVAGETWEAKVTELEQIVDED
jgi:glycosyltransferase involved in cell wall biosynthesis